MEHSNRTPVSHARLRLEYGWSAIGVSRAESSPCWPLFVVPNPAKTPVREPKVTVKIPRPLYRKIQQVVDGSGFNSPTDFIVYVLRDLMGDAPAVQVPPESGAASVDYTQDELDDVRRKLENLGYL